MQLLGCLIILVFILFFVVIAFFGSFLLWLRSLFGFKPRQQHHQESNNQYQDTPSQPTKKVFSDEEGEYVPFEEIKEVDDDVNVREHNCSRPNP